MKERAYENKMKLIYMMMKSKKYNLVVEEMMSPEGERLNRVYKFDCNHSWYVLGDAFFKMGNFSMAKKSFRKSLRSRPEDVEALMAIGNSYSAMGKYNLAERFFRKGLLLSPESTGIRFNLANSLFDQKKFDLALKEYLFISSQKGRLSVKAKKMIKTIRQSSSFHA